MGKNSSQPSASTSLLLHIIHRLYHVNVSPQQMSQDPLNSHSEGTVQLRKRREHESRTAANAGTAQMLKKAVKKPARYFFSGSH